MDDDENSEGCQTRRFPYSTVYSSPDGTGWYCMPEPGDAIRLYMPSDDEREAYAISAVHLAKTEERRDSRERINPDHKSIMNKYGKEILFTPSTLVLTNNKGMSVRIVDGGGIEISSDKDVQIIAGGSLLLQSKEGDIVLNGPESITLMQGITKIQLKENILIHGAQTNIQ